MGLAVTTLPLALLLWLAAGSGAAKAAMLAERMFGVDRSRIYPSHPALHPLAWALILLAAWPWWLWWIHRDHRRPPH